MTETAPRRRSIFDSPPFATEEDERLSYENIAAESPYAAAALERHKRQGMLLAVRARWVVLAVVFCILPILNFDVEVLYHQALLLLFALIGWLQLRVARVERSRMEVVLIFADLILLTLAFIGPNPLDSDDWPAAMQFRFQNFPYFYLFLAFGVLAYSWRTVRGMGTMVVMVWTVGVTLVWWTGGDQPELTEAVRAAFPDDPKLALLLDPQSIVAFARFQEGLVFLMTAIVLSIASRRYTELLHSNASLERERANLSRYFSPNVVEELSQNDEPLKSTRTQDVAVLFVDIVGFTRFASQRASDEVIETLRAFHQRMESEVFAHEGTLDKFLGDGLMATFGTPTAGTRDATNALRCALAMAASAADWNRARRAAGAPELHVSFGLHYGPAVLGDVGGSNRLEFAVIGDTVNVASRVEAMTRDLDVEIAMTKTLAERVEVEGGGGDLAGFAPQEGCVIRGIEGRTTLLCARRSGETA